MFDFIFMQVNDFKIFVLEDLRRELFKRILVEVEVLELRSLREKCFIDRIDLISEWLLDRFHYRNMQPGGIERFQGGFVLQQIWRDFSQVVLGDK